VLYEFRKGSKRSVLSPVYLVAAYFISFLLGVHWLVVIPVTAVMYRAKTFGIAFAAVFSLGAFYFNIELYAPYFVYILILSAIIFLGIASFKTLREHVLRETVKLINVTEGMILAKPVKNIKPMARGLTNEEISALKSAKVKAVSVRKSLPFTPIFTCGLIILLFAAFLFY